MLTLLHGDALTQLKTLESESVQTCVTSPPYWGLRDYGIDPIVWDEGPDCEHQWQATEPRRLRWVDDAPNSPKQLSNEGTTYDAVGGHLCALCGAWRGVWGAEPTPQMYVAHSVAIFREVKRVLRKDGTLWLNLGDSYCASPKGNLNGQDKSSLTSTRTQENSPVGVNKLVVGLKPKDLVGIPWRVAFALQADGWYLRSEVTWCKKSNMPESVKDRPRQATEKLFLLSRSSTYVYNQDAVRTPSAESTIERYKSGWNGNEHRDDPSGHHNNISKFCGTEKAALAAEKGANLRNWWLLSPEPFSDAHFATFPTEIPRRCILLGSNAGDVVLDICGGSGTTGKVAIELGRKAILIEPKAEYVEMIERRCKTTIGLPLAV